jgi:hypothetical protein
MSVHAHTDRLAVWLADHPPERRITAVITAVHAMALWAVVNAPSAAAATGGAALGWTGLHDSYGVALKDYFLSVVDTPEAITNNGQDVSILEPSSLLRWAGEAIQTGITHSTAAWWLTTTTSFYIFLVGVALWLLRFALSGTWLVVIAQIARPVYNAVTTVANTIYLGPITVTLCVIIGGVHILRGHRGRGWAIIGTGVLFTVLLLTVFADPIGDLYGDHGLLAMGRSVGFSIAQATRGAPYAPSQSLDAQVGAMLGELVTSGVRHPLQVVNFGFITDDVGGCADAWSRAVTAANGQGPGPAHAMANCGAPQALAHAQQLGGGDAVVAIMFGLAGLVFSVFIWYVAISTFLVGLKAAYFGTVVGPAFMVGMTGLAERVMAYAKHCGWQLLIHAIEMAAYTAFLGVVMVWMAWTLTTSMLGTGTITVMPRMLILMLASIAALLLFRFMDKQFHADGIGTIARTIRTASGNAGQRARGHYDDARARADQARALSGRLRDRYRRSGDGGDDGDASESTSPAPSFDTFKPRPSTRPAPRSTPAAVAKPGLAEPGFVAAQGAAQSSVGPVADAAATGATRAAAGTAARGAASVAAPEVAIPLGAAVAARDVARKHRDKRHQSAPATTSSQPATARSEPRASSHRDDRREAGSDTGHDTFSSRPIGAPRRGYDVAASGTDVAPTGVDAPPLETNSESRRRSTTGTDPDPTALEFGAARRTGTPANRKGEQQ